MARQSAMVLNVLTGRVILAYQGESAPWQILDFVNLTGAFGAFCAGGTA
jgi:hypothetical protein